MDKLLLTNETGAALYERYAKDLPIIDFHCHLQPDEILRDEQFEDLGEIWLAHDHYKWRCMRAFGIDEQFITGGASWRDKFMQLAGIMPMLAGNPVHSWCQLELLRYFGIAEPLGPDSAESIYERTRALIHDRRMSPRYFIAQSNVEYIATTDDPADDLSCHEAIARDESMRTVVAPALRPDRAMQIRQPGFADYIAQLGLASGAQIRDFDSLMAALDARMAFFKAHGARVTDHGVDHFVYMEGAPAEIDGALQQALRGEALTDVEAGRYQTAFLIGMARLCARHGLCMQMHIGAYRNVNTRQHQLLGVDRGFDAAGDPASVQAIGALLDAMDRADALPRTMLYPINSALIEPLATVAAAFCGGGMAARVSLGAPWWFNDQPFGIQRQFEAVSQLFPLALSAGMVTDSRSFLSYPRHELYRRALCDYLGALTERGEYVGTDASLGQIIEAVCYRNAKTYLSL